MPRGLSESIVATNFRANELLTRALLRFILDFVRVCFLCFVPGLQLDTLESVPLTLLPEFWELHSIHIHAERLYKDCKVSIIALQPLCRYAFCSFGPWLANSVNSTWTICVQFRQTTRKNDTSFIKTGNDRCAETFREAGSFAEQLKEIRRTIKALRAATEGALGSPYSLKAQQASHWYEQTQPLEIVSVFLNSS